jgi:sulfur-oxidizing protein SoxZ
MARALINVPATAKPGEILEIKTLIQHPMETGYRPGPNGVLLPRDIIRRFTCSYDGVEIFSAELHPALSANPFIAFATLATQSGTLTFTWTGDNGFAHTETSTITVG